MIALSRCAMASESGWGERVGPPVAVNVAENPEPPLNTWIWAVSVLLLCDSVPRVQLFTLRNGGSSSAWGESISPTKGKVDAASASHDLLVVTISTL